jgi:hypothetical protein
LPPRRGMLVLAAAFPAAAPQRHRQAHRSVTGGRTAAFPAAAPQRAREARPLFGGQPAEPP